MVLHAANSPTQAESFADLTALKRGAPFLQACLSEITVFEVVDTTLDEFASIVTLSAAGAPGEFVQPALNVRIQPDG
jgi:hypothetical protein